MKKRATHYKKDLAIVLLLFALSFASLALLKDSWYVHLAGVVFLITGTYGAVSLMKLGRFLYE